MTVSLIGSILTIPVRIITSDPFVVPSGTVILKKDSKTLGVNVLNAAGITTFTLKSEELGVGIHTLTAFYAGNKSHAASSFTIVQEIVEPITTTCAVSAKNKTVNNLEDITLICNIFAKEEITQGTVQFFHSNGNALYNSVNVLPTETGGSAFLTINTSILNIGNNDIFAVYTGGGKFISSSSDKFIQSINKIKSNNIITSNINPSYYNQNITLTAMLSGLPNEMPEGNITFYSGESPLCMPIQLSNGNAKFYTSSLAGGSHIITAKYTGNNKYHASISSSIVQLVNSARTETILTLNGNVLTANVLSPGGTANGNVSFYIEDKLINSIQLDKNGNVSFILNVNNIIITAKYSGSSNYSSSSATIKIK